MIARVMVNQRFNPPSDRPGSNVDSTASGEQRWLPQPLKIPTCESSQRNRPLRNTPAPTKRAVQYCHFVVSDATRIFSVPAVAGEAAATPDRNGSSSPPDSSASGNSSESGSIETGPTTCGRAHRGQHSSLPLENRLSHGTLSPQTSQFPTCMPFPSNRRFSRYPGFA